mmetsp:Transcript_32706/g.70605  ORF Transcript_32706/g.70605 Transcript_32706/m.70605 type:complete len:220 (-) Transcript_32706:1661-2320(-)
MGTYDITSEGRTALPEVDGGLDSEIGSVGAVVGAKAELGSVGEASMGLKTMPSSTSGGGQFDSQTLFGLQNPIPFPQSPAALRHMPGMRHGTPEHGVPSPFGSCVGLDVGDGEESDASPLLLPPPSSSSNDADDDGRYMPASSEYTASPARYSSHDVLPVAGSASFSASGATSRVPPSSIRPAQTSLTRYPSDELNLTAYEPGGTSKPYIPLASVVVSE